ncbi:MAG: hypothetical protein ACOCWQ_05365 [Nanoarchaeota archaeon]
MHDITITHETDRVRACSKGQEIGSLGWRVGENIELGPPGNILHVAQKYRSGNVVRRLLGEALSGLHQQGVQQVYASAAYQSPVEHFLRRCSKRQISRIHGVGFTVEQDGLDMARCVYRISLQ